MGDGRIKTCPLCGKPDYTHHACTTKKPKPCPDCGAELIYVGIQLVGNAPMENYDCPECERQSV